MFFASLIIRLYITCFLMYGHLRSCHNAHSPKITEHKMDHSNTGKVGITTPKLT